MVENRQRLLKAYMTATIKSEVSVKRCHCDNPFCRKQIVKGQTTVTRRHTKNNRILSRFCDTECEMENRDNEIDIPRVLVE